MLNRFFFAFIIILTPFSVFSQIKTAGTVSGRVIELQSQAPVEYANMVLRDTLTHTMVTGVVSDSNGYFRMTDVPFGTFYIEYSFIGYDKMRSKTFVVSRKQPNHNLGELTLASAAINMNEVTITGNKSMMINKIDRKVFNVQTDIQAQTGTAADMLQTIPSVSVDMDGNVSLRGSGSVTILINGRPSVMGGAANLEQMPASLIEKIEVITNPSAKYKPDGTGGIINIILKKERKAGFNGVAGANIGNNDRYNATLQLNLNTGKVNLFGSYGYRQDYRHRTSELASQTIDTTTNESTWFYQNSDGYARPLSHLVQTGIDWNISRKDAAGVTGIYNYRKVKRTDDATNLYQNTLTQPTEEFTRNHYGKETENSIELSSYYEHIFDKEKEHQFRLGMDYESDQENENDHYTNVYALPLQPDETDSTIAENREQNINITGNYSRPLWDDASMELGYEGNIQITDQNQQVAHLDPESGLWIANLYENNQFHANQAVHALYTTVSMAWKKISVMGGLRAEEALADLDFITLDTATSSNYFALYPTLHIKLASGKNEWQLNYSKRVNRPDGEDMNPVPEYRDPRNLFVGNPDLKPEDIHSVEFGYAIQFKHANLIPTLFYRQKVNGFTMVTSNLNDSTLVTTFENLAKDQSAGIDLSGTAQIAKIINLNFSASGYYSQIDASNIGYSDAKSTFSWNAKLNASVNITKTTLFQFNGQYRSEVLTPQGFRKPSWVVNLGFRQDFWKKKLSLIATVSDLFNSQVMKNSISTPVLVQETTRRRDARVVYAGFVFNFGTSGKKAKDAKFEFDNGMDR